MAYDIPHFDGTTQPVTGTNLYGRIKDDPNGTKVNEKSNGDIQVFFQRLMSFANITPSNLPDNQINGWQLNDALQTYINFVAANPTLGLAQSYADALGATGFMPVRVSGVHASTVSSITSVTAGWVWYNNTFIFCLPASISVTAGVLLATTTVVNGLPIAQWSYASTVTDATHFPYSIILENPIVTNTANISANTANIASNTAAIAALQPLPWTTTTLINSWVATGGMSTPRFTKNGLSKVSLQGSVAWAAGVTLAIFMNLPVGYRPSQDLYISTFGFEVGATPSQRPILIQIHTNGDVQIVSSTFSPATTSDFFVLDGINFDIL